MHLACLFPGLIEWFTPETPGELLPAKALDVLTGFSSITQRTRVPLLRSQAFCFSRKSNLGVCVVGLIFVLNRTCCNPVCVFGKTPLESVVRMDLKRETEGRRSLKELVS